MLKLMQSLRDADIKSKHYCTSRHGILRGGTIVELAPITLCVLFTTASSFLQQQTAGSQVPTAPNSMRHFV